MQRRHLRSAYGNECRKRMWNDTLWFKIAVAQTWFSPLLIGRAGPGNSHPDQTGGVRKLKATGRTPRGGGRATGRPQRNQGRASNPLRQGTSQCQPGQTGGSVQLNFRDWVVRSCLLMVHQEWPNHLKRKSWRRHSLAERHPHGSRRQKRAEVNEDAAQR